MERAGIQEQARSLPNVEFKGFHDHKTRLQELAGHATMLFYMTEEGQEGKKAYLEKRKPRFDRDGYRP